jgi:hypothetical protein
VIPAGEPFTIKEMSNQDKKSFNQVGLDVAINLTQPFDAEHDKSLIGLAPAKNARSYLPAYVRSKTSIVLYTVRSIPKHLAWEFLYQIIPLMAAIAFSYGFCKYVQSFVTTVDVDSGSLAVFTIMAFVAPRYHWLGGIYASAGTVIIFFFGAASMLSIFNTMLRSKELKTNSLKMIGHIVCIWSAELLFRGTHNHLWLGGHSQSLSKACFGGFLTSSMLWSTYGFSLDVRRLGVPLHKLNNLPTFMLTYFNLAFFTVQFSLYSIMLQSIAGRGDGVKGAFVLLVHPIFSELTGMSARFACRAVKHAHPSSSFQILLQAICTKKIISRFIVAMIESYPLLIFITSFNAILEFVLRYTMPFRDKAVYKILFSKYLPLGKNPTALLSDARNRGHRSESETLEALTDIVFIVSMLAWPLFMNAAECNSTTCLPATFENLWLQQLMQYVIETAIDLFLIVAMSVGQNYHVTQQSGTKCPYWTLIATLHVLFCLTLFYNTAILFTQCHSKTWNWDFFSAYCVSDQIDMPVI